jgi:hypothetical protein
MKKASLSRRGSISFLSIKFQENKAPTALVNYIYLIYLWNEFFSQYQVHFVSVGVSKEEHFGAKSAIVTLLEHFRYQQVFIQSTSQGISIYVFLRFNTQKKSSKARITEIKFRRFDDTFFDVFKKWRQFEYDKRCFQNTNPGFDGSSGDTYIIAKAGKVHNLSDSAGKKDHKLLKGTQIPDVYQATNVPLQIGLYVTIEKAPWFEVFLVYTWIGAGSDQFIRVKLYQPYANHKLKLGYT